MTPEEYERHVREVRQFFENTENHMRAKVKISKISIDAEISCDDPELQEAAAKIVENANERIEAAIAQAVVREISLLLPGINCTSVSMGWEDDE